MLPVKTNASGSGAPSGGEKKHVSTPLGTMAISDRPVREPITRRSFSESVTTLSKRAATLRSYERIRSHSSTAAGFWTRGAPVVKRRYARIDRMS